MRQENVCVNREWPRGEYWARERRTDSERKDAESMGIVEREGQDDEKEIRSRRVSAGETFQIGIKTAIRERSETSHLSPI
jgi:hypothetical protein